MIRESPTWPLLMGFCMMVAGAYGGCTMLTRAPAEDRSGSRGLARYTAPSESDADSHPPVPAEILLLLGVFGVGLSAFGVRQVRLEGRLLRDGVPVVGHISHVRYVPEREHVVTYRFEDDSGVVHEGTFEPDGLLHDDFEEGQEVTVLYDPQDPNLHMLDVDNVRRVDAKLRQIS
jgi:hypothetical protein